MRKIIIGGVPKGGIRVKDPNLCFNSGLEDPYIVYEEMGAKNLIEFLKYYKKDVTIFSNRMPPQNIVKLCNKVVREEKTLSFEGAIKLLLFGKDRDNVLRRLKTSGYAPRMMLKQVVRRSQSRILVDKLISLDAAGEPTMEALVVACSKGSV